MDYKKNRLVLGGVFGILGCLILLFWSHPIIGVLVLFAGFISSIRAVFNGAPLLGILLVKASGFMVILYPLFWAGVEKFQKERPQYVQTTSVTPFDAPVKVASRTKKAEIHRILIQNRAENVPDLPKVSPEEIGDEADSHPRRDVRDLVANLVRFSREAEGGSNLDLVMSQYASSVHYFGERRSRDEIRADKKSYWEKWPTRTEKIISEMQVTRQRSDEFRIEFKSSFRNEDPATGSWISADLSNHYTVELFGEEYAVTKQSCTVSNLKKGGAKVEEEKMLNFVNFDSDIVQVPRKFVLELEKAGGGKINPLELEAANIVRETLLAEENRDIEKTISAYARDVKYFGTYDIRKGIWIDKNSYFEKWPIGEDEAISKYRIETENENQIKVTLTTRFSATHADGSITRSGEIDHLFRLTIEKGRLLIFEQSGKVRNLKTQNPTQ